MLPLSWPKPPIIIGPSIDLWFESTVIHLHLPTSWNDWFQVFRAVFYHCHLHSKLPILPLFPELRLPLPSHADPKNLCPLSWNLPGILSFLPKWYFDLFFLLILWTIWTNKHHLISSSYLLWSYFSFISTGTSSIALIRFPTLSYNLKSHRWAPLLQENNIHVPIHAYSYSPV